MSPDVVGLGYCTYDILAIVPRLPGFDDVRMVHLADLIYDGGGMVGTALAALARLGVDTGYVGVLGDDAEGHWLRERLVAEGIDITRLRLDPAVGTNRCLLLVSEQTAGRSILCHARTGREALILDEADRALIQSARVLHLDGQFMPAAIQAARWARQAGVTVSFDGNHDRPGLHELLPLVDWLVVTEGFAAEYTAMSSLEAGVAALLDHGVPLLVVTQGDLGCRAWAGGRHWRIPAWHVPVLDTTGAGDAFHGGFIYGMLHGWDVPRSAAFAAAVAALNCRVLGGRRGLPDLPAVLDLLHHGEVRPWPPAT